MFVDPYGLGDSVVYRWVNLESILYDGNTQNGFDLIVDFLHSGTGFKKLANIMKSEFVYILSLYNLNLLS